MADRLPIARGGDWPQTVYFDCIEGMVVYSDLEGTACADLAGVLEAARNSLLAIAHDNLAAGEGPQQLRISARDESGRAMAEATLDLHVAAVC